MATTAARYHAVGVPIGGSPVSSPRGSSTRESEYYYTLVFRNTKAEALASERQRIRFCDAVEVVRSVTAGGVEREAEAAAEFQAAWVAKFRTPLPAAHDTISIVYFQELVRHLIVHRFDRIPGLLVQSSVSPDRQRLFLSLRPSRSLLCATADRLGMRVAMMNEIDPGESYWASDPTRAASEAYQWSKSDAQEELVRMYLAGKISSDDAQIFESDDDREDAGMWSRRLHALRRFVHPEVARIVAAKPPTETTHLVFRNRPSLRYLYRQIDGADDNSPFRIVDKIRLTKAIVDAEFDCDALVKADLLAHHFCAHTHHTDAVDTSIDVLGLQWGALFGSLRLYRQGLIRLTDLWSFQPILHVRNYFGEELALYFAYTSFYAHALQQLCGLAMVLTAVTSMQLLPTRFPFPISNVTFAVCSTFFMERFIRKWGLQERIYAQQWGVDALSEFALSSRSNLRVVHVAFALCAKLLGVPLAALCRRLNDWENYKTQHDYDLNLTLKYSLLQTVNLFGMLWVLTFVQPFVSPTICDAKKLGLDCLDQAAHLLVTMLAVDFALSLWDLRDGVVDEVLPRWLRCLCGSRQSIQTDEDRVHLLQSAPRHNLSVRLCAELELDEYDGVMFDYAQVIITFGFVVWFAALQPLAVLLAWGIATLQIRIDAFRLCCLTQRPFPRQSQSIGSWRIYLHFLALGTWIHNAALTMLFLCMRGDPTKIIVSAAPSSLLYLRDFLLLRTAVDSDSESEQSNRVVLEGETLAVVASFAAIAFLASVHDRHDRATRKRLAQMAERQSFLENKYINNLDLIPDSVRESLPPGRVFLNGVHGYMVTGDQREEDAAEEIFDELVQLQAQVLEEQKRIAQLREAGAEVGDVAVDVGSVNILPIMDALTKAVDSFIELQVVVNILPIMDALTKAVDSFIELQVVSTEAKSSKKERPLNTSVIKKNRSPKWTERFVLRLSSLDDAIRFRVMDWELLGRNRRIGQATLTISDIIATMPPRVEEGEVAVAGTAPIAKAKAELSQAETKAELSQAESPSGDAQVGKAPEDAASRSMPNTSDHQRIPMGNFDLSIEMSEALMSSMMGDLVRHGHPKLSIRSGLQLKPLGVALYRLQLLQEKIQRLKENEKQFFQLKL
ncbi:hypothetical protein P43SY_001708 [Pythium insidiosum]|uniref:C2 domain-containing protein n=1 Tax=Pythium insidiosum TaxID=114742 RepID=A0AAD5Q374_PYTIN|nr:hypothetical protein P43SY_001708 [Pythium insidiosum]